MKNCSFHLSAHDGHPAAEFGLAQGCRTAFDKGVAQAQCWLDNPNSSWLWVDFVIERELFLQHLQRHAFELGFLSRIHQRLCSPLGGGHQARNSALRL
ncbi:LasR-specific antiactivator QslA [Zestomonas carbonaria]|uniref:LasR-specific antiactivator QslA domain-containing protein n=1 Tax=Zestomonas carbonaria TaxID=2762745 RepID=A0A7U7EJD9_9GAMM|nr:LasR-specific antiactivator QslA [Pseudomonas carbonaria]CAD5105961.1 hypothetical protein PSEWESI4_00220 [Pseudomonas carbonaria]